MKVRELIEALSQFDPERPVAIRPATYLEVEKVGAVLVEDCSYFYQGAQLGAEYEDAVVILGQAP